MNSFTLTRACIRSATGWGAHRARTIIDQPYPLARRKDVSGPTGGGRTERFRLSDILARCRERRTFTEEMSQQLIAVDAAYRKENT